MILPTIQTLLNAKMSGGITPLMKAASCGSDPTVYYLLSLGADPLEKDNKGRTALSYAMTEQHMVSNEVVR